MKMIRKVDMLSQVCVSSGGDDIAKDVGKDGREDDAVTKSAFLRPVEDIDHVRRLKEKRKKLKP